MTKSETKTEKVPPILEGVEPTPAVDSEPVVLRLNVLQKVFLAMKDVEPVNKDGKNERQGYKFRRDEEVQRVTKKVLLAYGLISQTAFRLVETHQRTNKNGGIELYHVIECSMAIIDVDSKENFSVVALGGAQDNSDKAIMKAQTCAHREAWSKLWHLAEDNDPERDTKVDDRMDFDEYSFEKMVPKTAPRPPLDTRVAASPLPASSKAPEPLEAVTERALGAAQNGRVCPCGLPARKWMKGGKFMNRYFCGRPYGDPEKCAYDVKV